MKVTAAIATALLATTAVAAPTAAERRRNAYERRVARRAQKSLGHSRPPMQLNTNETALFGTPNTFSTTDRNWAGAVYTGEGIMSVSASSVNVPKVSVPAGGDASQTYGGAAWVGIDGSSCSVILQTGVDWELTNGQTTYNTWYEWYPEASYDFELAVSEGDSVSMSVVTSGAAGGSATVTNLSTGQKATKAFTGQQALCQKNAEWIVEDFSLSGGLVPFANFAPVTFSGAAFVDGAGTQGPAAAQIVNIQQSSKLTSCAASVSTVQCSYTG